MEEDMKVLTSDELLRCSKAELCDLFRQTETALCEPSGHPLDREVAMLNLEKIRRAITRLDVVI
jgi:hypothetical protein